MHKRKEGTDTMREEEGGKGGRGSIDARLPKTADFHFTARRTSTSKYNLLSVALKKLFVFQLALIVT